MKPSVKIFRISSISFGCIGVLTIITAPDNNNSQSSINKILFRLLAISGFVVLSSFALSVASKYLDK
ncbi:hypothetical protein KC960_03305 [Candidatus Saccharibacteria bacterium]|nr:hypothetical protein [Candidatus Saccharibacteria bacterium]